MSDLANSQSDSMSNRSIIICGCHSLPMPKINVHCIGAWWMQNWGPSLCFENDVFNLTLLLLGGGGGGGGGVKRAIANCCFFCNSGPSLEYYDVIKWKHFSHYWLLCGEFIGHRWIPLTKAGDAELWFFSLICAWINGWVNNRDTDDLRTHRAYYDVTVVIFYYIFIICIIVPYYWYCDM